MTRTLRVMSLHLNRCIACAGRAMPGDRLSDGRLCYRCRCTLRLGAVSSTPGGVLVTSAYDHVGAARTLTHRLKYHASVASARLLAMRMADVAPSNIAGWVPIPRARVRSLRYGVDPAVRLAESLAAATGIPVVPALRSGLWWASHARGGSGPASGVRVQRRAEADSGWVLVDDVATTGATIDAACDALNRVVGRAIVATSPSSSARNAFAFGRVGVERVDGDDGGT